MIFTVAALICCIYVVVRLLTRRGRRQLWWTCGTAAPAAAVAAGLLLANEQAVNAFLQVPNVAILLIWVVDIAGAGCWLTFWHAARHPHPSRRTVTAHGVMAFMVAVAVTALWLAAPIHQVSYTGFRDIPPSGPYTSATLVFCAFMVAVSWVGGWAPYRIRRDSPPRDAGLRVVLLLAIPTSVFVGVAGVLYAVWLPAQQLGSADVAVLAISGARLLSLLALVTVGVAGFPAFFVTRVSQRRRAVQLMRRLDPLWRQVRITYPAIALPLDQVPRGPSARAQRMLIEIGDGLSLTRISRTGMSAIDSTVHALLYPDLTVVGDSATSLLPEMETTRQEERVFSTLAIELTAAQRRRQLMRTAR